MFSSRSGGRSSAVLARAPHRPAVALARPSAAAKPAPKANPKAKAPPKPAPKAPAKKK